MFIDALLTVSDAQALTATAVSTKSIDTGNVTPKNALGDGEPMGFTLSVDVAADHTTGNETYQVDVVEDTAEDLGTATVIATYVLLYSQLTAGARFFLPLPPGYNTKRYIGLSYTLGGTTPTVTVTAEFGPQSLYAAKVPVNYAKGYVA